MLSQFSQFLCSLRNDASTTCDNNGFFALAISLAPFRSSIYFLPGLIITPDKDLFRQTNSSCLQLCLSAGLSIRDPASRFWRYEMPHGSVRKLIHIIGQIIMLAAGPSNAYNISLLECITANQKCRDLPRQYDDRNRIHGSRCYAGHGIGSSGPGCDQDNTRFACCTRIPVSRMNSALLVSS